MSGRGGLTSRGGGPNLGEGGARSRVGGPGMPCPHCPILGRRMGTVRDAVSALPNPRTTHGDHILCSEFAQEYENPLQITMNRAAISPNCTVAACF